MGVGLVRVPCFRFPRKQKFIPWCYHDLETLINPCNLGRLYADQGQLDVAEKTYPQALAGYVKALGPEHTSTSSLVNNLGLFYVDQGRLDEARM